jgi:hypothetical protein
MMNNPDTYSLHFTAEYFFKNQRCGIADTSGPPAFVPTPGFILSLSPSIISMRPGEVKFVE